MCLTDNWLNSDARKRIFSATYIPKFRFRFVHLKEKKQKNNYLLRNKRKMLTDCRKGKKFKPEAKLIHYYTRFLLWIFVLMHLMVIELLAE
jgi:hypothetical protein